MSKGETFFKNSLYREQKD